MHYLPARCDACSFVLLVQHYAHGAVLSPCSKCGAEVSVFPGAKHLASDRKLFSDLSEAVHATVSPGAATLCLAGIEDLAEDAPAFILGIIGTRMPTLARLIDHARFSISPATLAAMLLTLLRARSSMRSHSGFIVACGPVAPPAPAALRKSS